MNAIYRYEVPVDDNVHTIPLTGQVLHVGCRKTDVVEFWALHTDASEEKRHFVVVGTGQPLVPLGRTAEYVGTAYAPSGGLVWHLLEVTL